MPHERLSMRKVKDLLRMHFELGLSNRQIASSLNISPATVWDALARAKAAGLSWPLDPNQDDAWLEIKIYQTQPGAIAKVAPDCEYLHQELMKKSVTLMLLWQEYKQNHPDDGYQYTQFCERYHRYQGGLDLVLRQEYKAGERMFVDFSGDGIPITDPLTGVIWEAPLFVAVLGASSYTYAEAFPSQQSQYWISGHIHAFEFIGGVAELLIPDNTKTAVNHPCRYDPDLNRTYLEMAQHYHLAILPARSLKPRDKAKVESGVLVSQRWILAALRNHTFFSLEQANQAIAQKLQELNERKFQKLDTSRRQLFESVDRPALRSLPTVRYEFAEWSSHTVNIDYHIPVDGHFYSVPYHLCQKKVEARRTFTIVEIFFAGKRIASHPRSYLKGKTTTKTEHMPEKHRRFMEWNPERIKSWAGKAGPCTSKLADAIMGSKPHPELGYRACLGLIRLGQSFGQERLEAACQRALFIGSPSYKSVKSILKSGLDQKPYRIHNHQKSLPLEHENLRGSDYYQ